LLLDLKEKISNENKIFSYGGPVDIMEGSVDGTDYIEVIQKFKLQQMTPREMVNLLVALVKMKIGLQQGLFKIHYIQVLITI
jgi:hypothetical protein